MENSTRLDQHSISAGEEFANSLSHGLGLVLAIVALPILVLSAVRIGHVRLVVGASVFGGTMVLLYLASTLYHALTHEGAKRVARIFDHSAIFCLSRAPTLRSVSACYVGHGAGPCWS
jgi:hemolysin III